MVNRIAAGLITVALLGLAACTDRGDATSSPAVDTLPAPIQRVMERVAEIRGLEPVPHLRAEGVAREDVPELLESLLTDEDRALAVKLTTLYRLLGHFSEDQDYLGVYQSFGAGSILGLYSPAEDTLWVVSEDGTADFNELSGAEESTLAHELVHALQDYHFDLDAGYDLIGDNPDRGMAWTVAVEGDASWHQALYREEYLWRAPAGRVFAFGVVAQQSGIPNTFIRELLFPYTAGKEWVGDVLTNAGVGQLNDWVREPPSSTVCVLHLQRCLDGFEPVEVALPDLSVGLGGGWEREWTSTLGEFHTGNWLSLSLSSADASAAADGWDGDTFATYVNGDETLLVLHVAFSSPAEAAEFRSRLDVFVGESGGELMPGLESYVTTVTDGREFAVASTSGTAIVVAIANTDGPAERALRLLGEG